MICKFAIFGTFLLAYSAVHASQPEAPLDHRDQNHQSQSLSRVEPRASIDPFRTKWTHSLAGCVLTRYPQIEHFNSIIATLTIPTLTGSDGIALITMGIDVGNCPTGSLVIGIQGKISSQVASWSAWGQWLPGPRVPLDVRIKAGDVVTVSVNAPSPTTGTVMLDNETANRVASHNFNTTYDHQICMNTVGWGVQAVSDERGYLVTLADFGTVNFTDAMVTVVDLSRTYFPSGPSTYYIYGISQNGRCLTSVTGSGSTLIVQHA